MPRPAVPVLALAAALLAGCGSTYAEQIRPVRTAWLQGRYGDAARLLARLVQAEPADRHVFRLEEGIVALARRRPREALQALRRARDRLDNLAAPDALAWLQAVLTDDRTLPYRGEDYEHVLLRAVLALADLMAGGHDAAAFAEQVLEKQLEIIDRFEDPRGGINPKKAYKLVAFGSYLRGILSEESPLRLDVARREFRRVVRLAPDFPYGREALQRVEAGVHSRRGHGVVHVLALVGRGPYKVEVEEAPTAQALALAQYIWNLHRGRASLPQLVSLKIPALAVPTLNPTAVAAEVDGRRAGRTATVTDVVATAQREFEAMKDWILARAILRRAFKIVVTETAKEAARRGRPETGFLDLLFDVFGLVWAAAERADTRCWSLLPATFQTLRLELPVGEHELVLRACYRGRVTGTPQRVALRVEDGHNTYVLVLVPTVAGGPPPLVSRPAARPVPSAAGPAL